MTDRGDISDALEALRTRSVPYAYELACLASAAGFVNAPLLRHLRRHLLPDDADACAEASVWWADFVEHRGVNGVTFHPAALDALRDDLARHRSRDEAITAVQALHAGGPALLILEEQLIALALTRAPIDRLEARLAAAVAALRDSARSAEVYAWAERSLGRLPRSVRATAGAWALALAVQSRFGLSLSFDGGGEHAHRPRWEDLQAWLPKDADVALAISLQGGHVIAHEWRPMTLGEREPAAIAWIGADDGDAPRVRGTAFLIAPRYAITAGHVVDGALGALTLGFGSGHITRVRSAHRGASDWALLECESPPGIVPLARVADAQRWQDARCQTSGYPDQGRPEVRTVATGDVITGVPLQLSIGLSMMMDRMSGFSGAPVIVDGGVLGIICSDRKDIVQGVSADEITAEWPPDIPLPPAFDAKTITVPATEPRVVLVGDGRLGYRTVQVPRDVPTPLGPPGAIRELGNLRGEVWTVGYLRAAAVAPEPSVLVVEGSMSVRIHVGDAVALIALDVDPPRNDEFVGFQIQRDGKGLTFGDGGGPGADDLLRRFWYIDHAPAGPHSYEITRVSSDGIATALGIVVDTTVRSSSVAVGFTRGRTVVQTHASGNLNWDVAVGTSTEQVFDDTSRAVGFDLGGEQSLRPLGYPRLDFDTTPYRDVYAVTGGTAYRMLCAYLDECIADERTTVDAIASHVDHPDLLHRFEQLGKRLRIVLDDSKGHARTFHMLQARLRASGCHATGYHYQAACTHNLLIRRIDHNPVSVLTGSGSYSIQALHVWHHHLMRLDDAGLAYYFAQYFDATWQKQPASLNGTQVGNLGIRLSPSRSFVDSVVKDVDAATSSVLFSLYESPSNRVITAIERAQKRPGVLVAGVIHRPGIVIVVFGSERMVVELPRPRFTFGHGSFIAIDFNRPTALAIAGSATYSGTSERNGENAMAVVIRDRAIATAFAIEVLDAIDRLQGHASVGKQPWWWRYYDPADARSRMRELLVDMPRPASEAAPADYRRGFQRATDATKATKPAIPPRPKAGATARPVSPQRSRKAETAAKAAPRPPSMKAAPVKAAASRRSTKASPAARGENTSRSTAERPSAQSDRRAMRASPPRKKK
jgi:hypothetical protein